jgi:protoporphyrinogen oxidase
MASGSTDTEPPRNVGIIGGGILGMTLALRLQAQGCQTTVIEAAPEIGGLAGSHSIGG